LPYWRLFYHLVWATADRKSLISPELEPMVHGLLRSKAIALGATVYALNGMTDHVHLVASVPPKLSLATFIGKVKGATSTRINKSGQDQPFFWQDEYAAFSFDAKRLPRLVAYVENQKTHHATSGVIPALERTE
jgi:putative transposase